MPNNIYDILNNLGQSIGVAVNHIYEVYTKQAVVQGWFYLLTAMFLILFSVVLVIRAFSEGKKDKGKREENAIAIMVIASGFLIGISLFLIYVAINHFVNPEYFAIRSLIQQITGR
jgi:uncharacterized membrane-anchored protein